MKIQIMAFQKFCVCIRNCTRQHLSQLGLDYLMQLMQSKHRSPLTQKILFPTIVAAIELLTVWDLAQVLTIHS